MRLFDERLEVGMIVGRSLAYAGRQIQMRLRFDDGRDPHKSAEPALRAVAEALTRRAGIASRATVSAARANAVGDFVRLGIVCSFRCFIVGYLGACLPGLRAHFN